MNGVAFNSVIKVESIYFKTASNNRSLFLEFHRAWYTHILCWKNLLKGGFLLYWWMLCPFRWLWSILRFHIFTKKCICSVQKNPCTSSRISFDVRPSFLSFIFLEILINIAIILQWINSTLIVAVTRSHNIVYSRQYGQFICQKKYGNWHVNWKWIWVSSFSAN